MKLSLGTAIASPGLVVSQVSMPSGWLEVDQEMGMTPPFPFGLGPLNQFIPAHFASSFGSQNLSLTSRLRVCEGE